MTFASSQIQTGLARETGPVGRYEAVNTAVHVALSSQLVYTVVTTGFYRISGSIQVLVVGTGAGQTWDMDLLVDNGAVQTTANFVAAADALTEFSNKSGTPVVYYLPAGSTVSISTNSNGTETTKPKLAVCCVVEAL